MNEQEFSDRLQDALFFYGQEEENEDMQVHNISTFAEKGYLTIEGIVVKLDNGDTFDITILRR